MKGYFALASAIIAEVFGTTMLKLSDGFTNLLPSIGLVVGMALSFYFLTMCLKTIPLSTAYAIWAGVGTAITALLGVILWNDPFNILSGIGLIMVIGGVVLLNLSKSPVQSSNASQS
ncbi:QacE family quaternary ammonium compound efflux SMR transporter [Paenibacillus taichungensis]|uniref:QacE family quaternary ammonium compound efflux SMR transporter n=1 Tax=Paenibacillus taichungensis TaxID=484184 RepID=A0A329QM94_9BACL|nr:multidrug efflux SMR transporter [Paenibacillus taichungensis]RAW12859.1 QacE family quaternary ammonium compound efflux SMR transporter [Paenibacillus taichungensis]